MRSFWKRSTRGEAGHRHRRAIPTLASLEDRQVLSHTSYLTAVPGLIVFSTPYTGTPNFLQAHDGLAPVTITGQFVAENPSIKRRDFTTTRTRAGRVITPAADDGDVVRVLPQQVYADFHTVDMKGQVQPSGQIALTRVPYSTPDDPDYQKNKAKFVYQFNFTINLPYTAYLYDDQHLTTPPPAVGRQIAVFIDAQSRDSGYFTPILLNLSHNTASNSATS